METGLIQPWPALGGVAPSLETVSYLHLRSSSCGQTVALTTHNLDSQGGLVLANSEPKHSPVTVQPGDPGTQIPRNGILRKPETGEPGHSGTGHRGKEPFRNRHKVSRGSASEQGGGCCRCSSGAGSAASAGSARGEGTRLAARWRDTGDTPTPRVRVLPEKSPGLGSAPASPERPAPWTVNSYEFPMSSR